MMKFLRLLPLACVMAFAMAARPAAADDPAAQQIGAFYDVLLDSMKHGTALGVKGRYAKLEPAVEAAYDLEGMTALSVGPTWSTISADDRKALVAAFTRLTVASYAQSFDSYGGEKFTVDPNVVARGEERYVLTQLVPVKGDPVAFNYRMHEVGGAWKILDVYLAGNISQLAQKRSDFSATLASGGPKALAQKINALSDKMLAS